MSATGGAGLVWELAGRPDCGKPTVAYDGLCYVCAEPCPSGVAVKAKLALGINFDHTQARQRASQHVCAACMWALAGKPPLTLRMWSGVACEQRGLPPCHEKCAYTTLGDRIHLTNRADMRTVAQALCDPPDGPWVVWIAVSGQKHVLPYTVTNHGTGPWAVRVEDATARSTPPEFALILARVIRLRQVGIPETAILAGDPGTWVDRQERLDAWRAHGVPLTALANSPLLQMACMIPTKGTIDDLAARYGHHATIATPEPVAVGSGPDRDRGDLRGPDDELCLL